MAGRGANPKAPNSRRTRHVPERGEWRPADGIGWQHDPLPPAPPRLLKASRETWDTWLASWFAAHWTPSDVPALRQIIRLYDQVERKEFHRATELRLMMDTYGITPKGQQDRRWTPPVKQDAPANAETPKKPKAPRSPYGHLRAVV